MSVYYNWGRIKNRSLNAWNKATYGIPTESSYNKMIQKLPELENDIAVLQKQIERDIVPPNLALTKLIRIIVSLNECKRITQQRDKYLVGKVNVGSLKANDKLFNKDNNPTLILNEITELIDITEQLIITLTDNHNNLDISRFDNNQKEIFENILSRKSKITDPFGYYPDTPEPYDGGYIKKRKIIRKRKFTKKRNFTKKKIYKKRKDNKKKSKRKY